MDIKASSSHVSDVSDLTGEPSHVLKNVVLLEVSHNGNVALVVPVVSIELDRHDHLSVGPGSDGSSSSVEDPPLLVVVWVVVLDSQSVLVVTNMLSVEQGSSAGHSGLDLESQTVFEWVSWEVWPLLVNVPGLVKTVVAVEEDNVHVVNVSATWDIKACA